MKENYDSRFLLPVPELNQIEIYPALQSRSGILGWRALPDVLGWYPRILGIRSAVEKAICECQTMQCGQG